MNEDDRRLLFPIASKSRRQRRPQQPARGILYDYLAACCGEPVNDADEQRVDKSLEGSKL